MKTAVYCVAIGESEDYRVSNETIRAYADKIGADFILDTEQTVFKGLHSPHVQKLRAYELLNEYDRILYLDSDIIVNPNARNVFLEFPDDSKAYMYNENFEGSVCWQTHEAMILAKPGYHKYVKYGNPKYVLTPYYNTGVVLISRKTRELFNRKDYFHNPLFEQSFINWNVHANNIPVSDIGLAWNGMVVKCRYFKTDFHNSQFWHFGGVDRATLKEAFNEYYGAVK